jgi:hypothetical protein
MRLILCSHALEFTFGEEFCNTNVGGVATVLQFPFPSCAMLHKWYHKGCQGLMPGSLGSFPISAY